MYVTGLKQHTYTIGASNPTAFMGEDQHLFVEPGPLFSPWLHMDTRYRAERENRNRNTGWYHSARLARYGNRDRHGGFLATGRRVYTRTVRVSAYREWDPGDTFTCMLPMSDRLQACGPTTELALQFRSTGQRIQFPTTDNTISADPTMDLLSRLLEPLIERKRRDRAKIRETKKFQTRKITFDHGFYELDPPRRYGGLWTLRVSFFGSGESLYSIRLRCSLLDYETSMRIFTNILILQY